MALCWTAQLFCNGFFVIPSAHVNCVVLHTLLGLAMGRSAISKAYKQLSKLALYTGMNIDISVL